MINSAGEHSNNFKRWLRFLVFSLLFGVSFGEVRYVLPEEMQRRSVIGNVARDLGLRVAELGARRARVVAEGTGQLCELDTASGNLLISQRIDREELCAQAAVCIVQYQLLLEDPLQAFSLVLDVADINDNSPVFVAGEIHLDLVESTVLGRRFPLESAHDPDLGTNSVREYKLSPNDHFALEMSRQLNGNAYPELVLKKALDREAQAEHFLKINGIDGGNPPRSGTASIHIRVLDANDNIPVFNQRVYKASVPENAPFGTVILTLNATDLDEGVYGEITYSFSHLSDKMAGVIEMNPLTGEVRVSGRIDYEEASTHELDVQAKDGGGQASHCKLIIDVIDVNDNEPVIEIKSASANVAEDSKSGTMVALINIYDLDTGSSGRVTCTISNNCTIEGSVPFQIKSNVRNYYALITDAALDREHMSECNITVIASDAGLPPLSTKRTFYLKISDVNDNAPVFPRGFYSAFIAENNSPGVSVLSVKAEDPDENQNARVSYILEDCEIGGSPVSDYISVNAENGVIRAVRSYDYEQIKELIFIVKAQDGGSPPLSSNVTVKVLIQDQNDNPPQVLYPVQTGGSLVAEMVPRSADVGYLVTKVVAVDVDSGQNAWLSYKVQKATDRALFEVGSQNGEIRTIRQVTDKDAVKQRLTVIVEDNGQPSRSATVVVNVAVADSFPEVLSEFTDFTHDKEYNDNLTFYLVLALAVVSFLFITCLVVIISVKIYRWRQSRVLYHSNLPVIPYYPPRYSDTLGTGTLQHVYNYEVCRTTDSRKSDCKFGRLLLVHRCPNSTACIVFKAFSFAHIWFTL
uniref:Cadherin domain-containing protein n=1 Tax=Scophthalmus maximus TaxID=52904 RepID=A0A8D3CWG2_SCOMX